MATLQQIAAVIVFSSALVVSVVVICKSLADPRVRAVLRDFGGW